MRGRRRLARRMRRGLELSRRAASWTLGTTDRLTSNRLARPLREPVILPEQSKIDMKSSGGAKVFGAIVVAAAFAMIFWIVSLTSGASHSPQVALTDIPQVGQE